MTPLDRLRANVGAALLLLLAAHLSGAAWPAWLAAALLLLAALDLPPVRPVAALWAGAGRLLHRLVAPVALFLLYYALFVPFALFVRPFRRGAARRYRGDGAPSMWEERPPERRVTDFSDPW